MSAEPQPVDPREAFHVVPPPDTAEGRSVAASQAALLLAARDGVLGLSEREEADLVEQTRDVPFDFPPLRPLERTHRLRVAEATRPLEMSRAELRTEPAGRVQEAMAQAVHRLYAEPEPVQAAALFEAGMHSPDPLVRVAAAAGARESTRWRAEIAHILHEGIESPDPLVAALARVVTAQVRRDDDVLRRHLAPTPEPDPRDRGSRTAVLTHGTWGSDQAWYQPGGDFYEALEANRPDLHVHDRSYRWSGAYTDAARRAAARRLVGWVADEGLTVPDLFAHSHGGTVAHLATHDGAAFDRLVLLAWPVHPQWYPDPAKVGRLVDVRVHLDLVIMADRGGQRLRDAPLPVEEHVNGWFDHVAVHRPEYWDRHDLWHVV